MFSIVMCCENKARMLIGDRFTRIISSKGLTAICRMSYHFIPLEKELQCTNMDNDGDHL